MTDYKNLEIGVNHYCRLGYYVFPLVENSKFPYAKKEGGISVVNASNDGEVAREHLARFPNSNLAIAAKNCLILDIDDKDGKNGSADFAEMEKELGPLPKGPKAQTPTGGFHLYFAKPLENIKGRTKIIWKGRETGIDLRVGNQYALVAPSSIDGSPYRWIEPLVPVDQLPELPAAWINVLPQHDVQEATSNAPLSCDNDRVERCRKYVAKMKPAISGQNGHGKTFHAACVIFIRFRLSEEDGFPILLEYNERCRPKWSEAELRHKMEDAIKKAAMTPYRIDLPSMNSFDFSDEDEQDATIRNWVPFPLDLLPDPLSAFVESSARSIGCDPALIVCPLLAGLAAAIGNCRVICLKDGKDPWLEPSIFWAISVAPPGAKKTAALNVIRNRFRKYEKQARHDNETELLEYNDAQHEFESQLKKYQKGNHGSTVSDSRPTRPDIPVNNGIIVGDTTVEGLSARMRNSNKGLALFRDELSAWFWSFGKYSKGGDSDTPFYLESYEGGVYSVTRKTTDSFTIERCSICITGTIQPRVLSRFFNGSNAADNGFMQRFMFVFPPFKKAYWSSQGTDSAAIEGTQKVFDYLFLLPFSNAEHDPDVLKLSPEAQNLFIAEHDRLEDEKSNEKSDLLRGFLSKHCGKVARLAIVFHCVKEATGDSLCSGFTVDADSMKRAIGVAQWFYDETVRCMMMLGCGSRDNVVEVEKSKVLSIIKAKGPITKRDIQRSCSKLLNLAGALTSLLADGRIVQRENKPEGKGRPTFVFEAIPDDVIAENDTNAPASDA